MSQPHQTEPDHRIILLGASNLTLGLPRLVQSFRASLPGTVEVLSAHGHGRSYLKWSYVIHRGLPSIRDCSLWEDLKARPAAKQTYALVTDLGCDLFYGSKPGPIVDSVAECLQNLTDLNAKIVLARPPLESLSLINHWHYYFVKNTFFPGPTIPWPTMREYITEVDERVLETAKTMGIANVAPKKEWYGYDPIHMKRAMRNQAWDEILSAWQLPEEFNIEAPKLSGSLHIWTRKAASRKTWWMPQLLAQPAHQWQDGSSLSIY